jgi:hypothetical protein
MTKHSRDNGHPSMQEASICIGAALAFTLDNWDNFAKEWSENAEDFPKGIKEVKAIFQHLFKDVGEMLEREAELEIALAMAKQILFK